MVHPGVQLRLLAGFGLRLSAGSLAVWNCRRYLVAGGSAPLVAGNKGGQPVLGILVLGIVVLGILDLGILDQRRAVTNSCD